MVIDIDSKRLNNYDNKFLLTMHNYNGRTLNTIIVVDSENKNILYSNNKKQSMDEFRRDKAVVKSTFSEKDHKFPGFILEESDWNPEVHTYSNTIDKDGMLFMFVESNQFDELKKINKSIFFINTI